MTLKTSTLHSRRHDGSYEFMKIVERNSANEHITRSTLSKLIKNMVAIHAEHNATHGNPSTDNELTYSFRTRDGIPINLTFEHAHGESDDKLGLLKSIYVLNPESQNIPVPGGLTPGCGIQSEENLTWSAYAINTPEYILLLEQAFCAWANA